jgi:predicted aspartyl protease
MSSGWRVSMTKHRASLAALFALLLCQTLSSAAQDAAAPAVAQPASDETRVGATMSASNRMLVNVTVDGAGPFPFIVDTAAERSVISTELVAQLGLASAGRARLLSMTSARNTAIVDMPNVSFGQGRQRLRAFALDGQNLGASGVLGIDALRGQRVILDFEAGEMRVGPSPRNFEPLGPTDIVVRARARFGELVLIDSDADGTPVDVVVDSGLQVSVGNEALRRLLAARQHHFDRIELVSVTGESFQADYTRVDNLRIGGVAIRGMPVAFSNAYFFTRVHLTRRPALMLGMDALQMFRRVAVDFPNRRAHFVLPADAARG